MRQFIFIVLLSSCHQSASGQVSRVFPKDWGNPGNGEKILAWVHKVDERPLEIKTCLTLKIVDDSAGKKEYIISHMYAHKPFTTWLQASIYNGPTLNALRNDVHIRGFDHKPTEAEIYKLLNRWRFRLKEENWSTIEYGIDQDLWLSTFGYIPDRDFRSKIRDKWKRIDFDGKWTIDVPDSFMDSAIIVPGADSDRGLIYSGHDSMSIGYECAGLLPMSFHGITTEYTCDLAAETKKANESITSSLNNYKELYGDTSLYHIYLDTIDSRIAIIVLPLKENGTMKISIQDCRSQGFITLWSQDISSGKKKLLLEVSKTVKFLRDDD